MAEDLIKWDLRPAWRLAIAVVVGLVLTAVTLAWPAIVRGQSPPEIIQVEVTSSKSTFFYSPPLGDSGGDTYFNNASEEEGAGQIITVTVVVADDNPTTFSGGDAFGIIAPSTNISTSYGVTSTWSVSYTIQSSHGSYNNIAFTILDGDGDRDTVGISFIQDNVDPQLELVDVTDPQYDLDGNELNVTGNWYRTSALTAGWSFTATMTETDSGYDTGLATWNHTVNNDHDQTIAPTYDGLTALNGTFTDVYTDDDGLVFFTLVVTDRVGNVSNKPLIGLNLDGTPAYAPVVSYLPDTDSGGDGFDPDTGYYDDPTIDATWSDASDGSGSGVAGYYLDTQTPPGTDLFYTGTTGVVTATGNYSDAYNLRVYITTLDNVGNIGNNAGQIAESPIFLVRVDPPSGNDITIQENTGSEYLYISDPSKITEGTLFYNNTQPSSFTVTGNTSFFTWGYNTPSWKVVFTPGWGELTADERFGAPYNHTYSIEPLETTNIFTVYVVNRAGNVQGIPIDAVEDVEAPQVTFTDVTDPQYDPDGDKLNSEGNWYRTSLLDGGWAFTATTTDSGSGYASSLADWDHQDDGYDQSITPDFNGADTLNGTFENVSANSDSAVQVTVTASDYVSNVGTDTLRIQLDGTPPDIDARLWDEDSNYLTVQGGVLYFNKAMPLVQTAIVSGTTTDGTGSGLDRVEYEQKPNLASDPVSQPTTGDWSSSYGFNSDTGEGPDSVLVTIFDNVGNSKNHAYDYAGLTDQPIVALDQVTEPGHDLPPYDPLDDIGNWYAERDLDAPSTPPLGDTGWWFYAVITPANSIDIVAASAAWDHEDGSLYSQTIEPDPSNESVQGTFDDVAENPSGLVAVTLTITDEISRMAADTLLVRIDKDGPAITDDGWKGTGVNDYLHVIGSTLFFGHKMGTAQQTVTLGGRADDGPDGAGAASVAFSSPESLGPSTPNPSLPDWSIQYLVSNSSTDNNSPVQVTVEDNLENQTVMTYPYVLDDIPPSTPTNFIITTPPVTPGYYNTQSLGLSWDASNDNVGGSGLLGYDLRANTSPARFYAPTITSATWDTGADGRFTFHLEARDNVANTSLTSTERITVDTVAPVSMITATPDGRGRRILVEWSAEDPAPGTGAVSYDVEYRVTETGPWQPWLAATTDTSAFFGPNEPIPVEFVTIYCYRVRAVDYVGNLGVWKEVCATLGLRQLFMPMLLGKSDITIPPAVFDGFESGNLDDWKVSGVLPSQIVSHPVPPADGTPPNAGTYAARLGNPNYGCENVPIGRATIQARASVPASGTPYLRFDYRVLSYDTVQDKSGVWWDRLEVRVNDDVLARYGDPDPGNLDCGDEFRYDSGWDQAEFDLSDYAGQSVVLTFFNENHLDHYYNTYSYLDNIRIEVD